MCAYVNVCARMWLCAYKDWIMHFKFLFTVFNFVIQKAA